MLAMYVYVGTAKTVPDSFSPRRFSSMMTAMRARPRPTRCSRRPRKAGNEMSAATPAEIDTATVRM